MALAAAAVVGALQTATAVAGASQANGRAVGVRHDRVSDAAQAAPDASAQIVAAVNGERTANRIPPVMLSSSLGAGCHALDGYEHLHGDTFVHSETPGSPGYSAAGNAVARSGPLLSIDGGSSVTGWGNNPYESGPNRLYGLLNPRESIMGADDSVFAESQGLVEEICVVSATGSQRRAPTSDTVYTGDGTTIYPQETANEEPETPGQSVGIPGAATTGPYLLIWAEGPFDGAAATIASASLTGPQGPVKIDIVNRQGGAGGFLIPVCPLTDLATYQARVTFTISGATLVHAWTFQTNADANQATGPTGAGTTTVTDAARQQIVFKTTLDGTKPPLKVVFQINPCLPRPITSWQISFGDGLTNHGAGTPPHFAGHTYDRPGTYHVLHTLPQTGGERASTTATVTIPGEISHVALPDAGPRPGFRPPQRDVRHRGNGRLADMPTRSTARTVAGSPQNRSGRSLMRRRTARAYPRDEGVWLR